MRTLHAVVFSVALVMSARASAGEIKPYTQEQFDQLAAMGKPIVVAVHADWCPTCKAQKPIIDSLMRAPSYAPVTTLIVDFDADKATVRKYKVAMQSTLIAFRGTKEVDRSVGDTSPGGIEHLVKKTLAD